MVRSEGEPGRAVPGSTGRAQGGGPVESLAQPQLARWAPLLVWSGLALFTGLRIDQMWIPWDEGLFGQSAERILSGEVPHRDFTAAYSGGLELLNAGAFALFGTQLPSLRVPLLAAFLAWLPLVYRVARGFLGVWGSSIVMGLCGLAAVPQGAPPASWYTVFLAVASIGAILSGFRSGLGHKALLGGMAAGLGVWIKITGLYTVAGGILALAWYGLGAGAGGPSRAGSKGFGIVLRAAVVLLGVAFMGLVAVLVRGVVRAENFIHLALPAVALTGVLVWRASQLEPQDAVDLIRRLCKPLLAYLLGFAAVVSLGLLLYAHAGALGDAARGILVSPFRRVAGAAHPMLSLVPSLIALSAVLPLLLALESPRRVQWVLALLIVTGLGLVAVLYGRPKAAAAIMTAARALVPASSIWVAVRWKALQSSGTRGAVAWGLASTTAVFALIQFPFGRESYFFYVAPLLILTLSSAWSALDLRLGPLAVLLVALAGAWLTMNSVNVMEAGTQRLDLARGGLRVPPGEAEAYEGLVAAIDTLTRKDAILALPDAPEVYFLSGKRNPTRSMFDFLDDPKTVLDEVRRAVERGEVDLVVTPTHPRFSGPLPDEVRALIVRSFSDTLAVGPFVLYRRGPAQLEAGR